MCPRLGASPRSRGGSICSPQSQEGTREGVQCAGLIRAEASGEALVRGSSGRRTCSGGARPRERLRGPPGAGEVHGSSRATPRNHATRVSTEPARSTPSRMTPALTRDRSEIACCAPLYVVRLMCASTFPATIVTTETAATAEATATTAATATATATTAVTAAATAVAIAAATDGGSGKVGGDKAGDQRV